ncbi:MAG TPA: TonB-dependent receptor [Thermoanaerobaculia bacterium]|nr:TonB-dependent receptor [Thermoanaerobaculia bacterium]
MLPAAAALALAGLFAQPGETSAAVASPAGASPQRGRYAGRLLSEVLRGLEGAGLTLVFTSELVRPEMRVQKEPAAREPRRILDEILAPFGLEAREGAPGVLVIVARARGGERTAIAGKVPDVPALYIHDEMIVRPSRLEILEARPGSAFSLDREAIESLPHLGGDLFRTAPLLPGVAGNDVSAQFSVHGGRRDEVRIVLDGQELFAPFHLADYDSALSIVPAHTLAGATLTTGAFPAAEGDRMSGVLDLRTLEPAAGRETTLGLSVLDLLASSSARSADGRRAWLLSGRRGSLDLARRAIGAERPRYWDALGKVSIATDRGQWTGRALAASDRLSVADTSERDGFERLDNAYRSRYLWLTNETAWRGELLVETIGSWARVETDRAGRGGDEEGGHLLLDRRDLTVASLGQSASLGLGARNLLKWGYEARRYDVSFDYAKRVDPDIVVIAPPGAEPLAAQGFSGPLQGNHFAVWTSDQATLGGLTAELGLRYDRHTASGDRLVSPRLSLGWRAGEHTVLRAAWGRFFQSQRPYELAIEEGARSLRRAELSEHRVLGFERLFDRGPLGLDSLRIELFERRIDDPRPRLENLLEPINFFPEIEPDRVRVAPESSAARGLEILVRGKPRPGLSFWLAYSLSRATDRIGGETVPRPLDQRHAVTLDADFRLPRDWSLNLAWRYHTGWPTTPVAIESVPSPSDPDEATLAALFGRLDSRRLGAYHRLDLRASRRFDLRAGKLTAFLDVQNLYDRQNPSGFDLAIDPEAGIVGLRAESWPGIFPSLGVTWTW